MAAPLPSPPDDGHAGYLARLDQYESAILHARRSALALLTSAGGRLVNPPEALGPWASATLASVAPRPGRRRGVCEHLSAERSPAPVYVLVPRVLGCYHCLMVAMDARMSGPEHCDMCGRPEDTSVVILQTGVVVAWGQLCTGCLTAEMAPPT